MGRKKPLPVLRGVTIVDIGSEGNAIAKVDDMVLFVPGMIPGDVVDVRVTKKKKRYMEGVALEVITPSPERIKPPCPHFGVCGGCRWQHLPYERQLFYKAKQVTDNLTRIGHISIGGVDPILGSEKIYGYRNKLEFTFSDKRWLTREEMNSDREPLREDALGFHIPGQFDKVLDIKECLLQAEPSNAIRNAVRRFAHKNAFPFFNLREQAGFLRNLVVRTTSAGEVMVIVVFFLDERQRIEKLMSYLAGEFPQITSLFYIVNTKKNDSLADQNPVHYSGSEFLTEEMDGLKFRIGPKSFFQTNTGQSQRLYRIAGEFAQLTGKETVYDLYTGTGTIANFLAPSADKVVGIEYIDEAIRDAAVNSQINGIGNTDFFAGDIRAVMNPGFFEVHGKPDVIVTDPPRSGMHEDVVRTMIEASPSRIVYISCNPATQARDVAILSERYRVDAVQPVDMFPQTHHVENVVLLSRL